MRTSLLNSNKVVIYTRVSSTRQGRSGLGLEAQQAACETFAQREGFEVVASYKEVRSGADDDRPQLKKTIKRAQRAGAHILIAKLDRLSRKVSKISKLMDEGVCFVVAALGRSVDPFFLHLMASFAESERARISERVSAALQAKKARGDVLGNPEMVEVQKLGVKVRQNNADQFALKIAPTLAALEKAGISTLTAVSDHLNDVGLTTRRAKQWTPTAVRNIKVRLASLG